MQRVMTKFGNGKDSPAFEIEDKTLRRYKRVLLVRVVGSFLLVFLIILERIFSDYTHRLEQGIVDDVQERFGIHTYNDIPGMFRLTHEFKYTGLVFTHIYFSLFFGANALITLKCLLTHFNAMVVVSNLEILFGESRPFWDDSGIIGVVCDPSYAFPSFSIFTVTFFLLYASHCWSTDDDDESTSKWLRAVKWILLTVFMLVYCFSSLIMGLNYPTQILLALLYSVLVYFAANFFDKNINDLVMKSSIQIDSAKRLSIYWLVYLILLAGASATIYTSADIYLGIARMKNFLFCLDNREDFNYNKEAYYHLMGPWPSFVRTSILFAMVGTIFGVTRTFRELNGVSWFPKSRRNKLIMVLIINAFILPFWPLIYFQDSYLPLIAEAGINEYLFYAILYASLYYIGLGIFPKEVFARFKLVETDTGYFVPPEVDLRAETLISFQDGLRRV